MGIIQGVRNFFSAIPWEGLYFFVRGAIIFLDIVLVIAFVWVFILALEYRPKFLFNPEKPSKKKHEKDPKLAKKWQEILLAAEKNPPHSFILAIIEADKFTDEALKKMGLKGEHMADRLERLNAYDLKTLDKVWRVHRVRNELVHSPDFNISSIDVKEILSVYEKFLKELGIL